MVAMISIHLPQSVPRLCGSLHHVDSQVANGSAVQVVPESQTARFCGRAWECGTDQQRCVVGFGQHRWTRLYVHVVT